MRFGGRQAAQNDHKGTREPIVKTLHQITRTLRGGSALQALALVGATAVVGGAFAAPAAAQDFTNVTATGRVTDASGTAIPGATVSVTSDTQGFNRTVTTDSSGSYRVPQIPQGPYTFEISAPNFGTYREEGISLTQSTAGNAFQLAAAGSAGEATAGGEIVVTGRRVQVSDFDRTTTGAVIQIGELADRVPVARDITSVILLAPGTSQGDSAFGSLASVSGSSVSENAFFLNGLNITEFREGLGAVGVPFDFYNTVEVKNGGIPAEFGRFTGGFINATTKSGGNEFHGGVLFNWQPEGLYENAPNALGAYNNTDTRELKSATFELSGPIIKDRLFFYGLYQTNDRQQSDDVLAINVGGATPVQTGVRRDYFRTTSPFWGGKLDAIITDGHRLEFTYFDSTQVQNVDSYGITYNSSTGEDTDPVLGDYAGSSRTVIGGENYVGRYTGQFTDWLTVSAAYGKNKNNEISGSTDDSYPFISDQSGQFSPVLAGNTVNVINDNTDEREFYRADVDVFFNAFGQHHIKAGYDKELLTTNAVSRYTGGVAYTYQFSGAGGDDYAPPNTLYVTGRTFINGGTFKSENEAFYIQDAWSLFDNRLTLNLGVRNDRFSNDNVAGATYYESGDAWAPRLSFALDPFGDSRTKVYGSFGRYYLPVVANTNIRLAGAETDFTSYYVVAGVNDDNTPILGAPLTGFPGQTTCPDTGINNCDIISDGEATPTEATVAKGLKPQSVDEYILGIEQNVGERWKFGIFGQYRTLNDSLEDVAIDAAVLNYCEAEGIAGCDDIWTGFHQYVLVNPGTDARITLSDTIGGEGSARTVDFSAADLGYPQAERVYKAVTLTAQREFDGVWSLDANYTWSNLEGNIEGGVRSDNGQTDSGLTTAFDQPGLVNGAFGLLPTHREHRFKLFGSYAPFDWLTLGLQFQAESPRKFGCIGTVPLEIDPFAGAYGAAGFYCNVDGEGNIVTDPTTPVGSYTRELTPRGSVTESDWLTFTNLSAAVKLPSDLFSATLRMDVFNIFNEKAVLDIRELGTLNNGNPRNDFGMPLGYQTPRYFRFQLAFDF